MAAGWPWSPGWIVLSMGLYTLNGGLEPAGSPLAASRITGALRGEDPPADTASASTMEGQPGCRRC